MDYEGIGALAEALAVNTSLKTLGLRCAAAVCGVCWALGAGSAAAPVPAWLHDAAHVYLPRLAPPRRSDNYIQGPGAELLATALQKNSTLQVGGGV